MYICIYANNKLTLQLKFASIMCDSEDDDIPDLVPAEITRVPITIITGFLGTHLPKS